MKLYDSFLFNSELDMLQCRLVQLESSPVYRHILVEARTDHQGRPKPLYYADNRERFAPWRDRIIHVITDLPDQPSPYGAAADAMAREGAQREAIVRGLGEAEAGDMLILADCDEIPSDEAVAAAAAGHTGVLEMHQCVFYVDLLYAPLRTSVVSTAGAALAQGMMAARRDGWVRGPVLCGGPRGGHHLGWLGGEQAVEAKLAAHCHIECNEDVRKVVATGAHWRTGANPFARYGYGGPLQRVDIDSSWPRWVAGRHCPDSWFRPRE